MSDPVIGMLQDKMPRLNPEICEGLAMSQLDQVEDTIHQVMLSIAKSFPEGVTYHGYSRCTPKEQFLAQSNLPNRPSRFDMSPSDLYMVKFHLQFNGKPMKHRYMLLPYANRGGTIQLRTSVFHISPAVVDNLFSVEDNNVFVPLTRSRINFSSIFASYIADGQEVYTKAVFSPLFKPKKEQEQATHRWSTLANYLFAYHGMSEAYKRYFGLDVVYGLNEINEENYPRDKWVICSSDGNRSTRRRSKGAAMDKSPIRLAIPRKQYFHPDHQATNEELVAATFFVLDHLCHLGFMNVDDLDNPGLWSRALIRFIFKNADKEKKYMEQIEAHLETLNHYVDELVRRKLKAENIPVTDMKGLIHYMMVNYTRMVSECQPNDNEGKCLSITQFVLFDIVCALFKMMYATKKLEDQRLTPEGIEKAFRTFPVDKIFEITTGHGEVSTLETASDCLIYKVTTPVISQTKATGKSENQKASEMKNPAYALHPSVIGPYSYVAINKSEPSGKGRVNPFIKLGKNGRIISDPGLEPLMRNVEELLAEPAPGHIPDSEEMENA